jgi:hypothetical protein
VTLQHYILKDGKIVPAELLEWAKWFGTSERFIIQETIAQNSISTIFLGLDHSLEPGGPPILWETMTFGAKLDQGQMRCAGNQEQAEAMHEEMVRQVCEAYGIPYDRNREKVKVKDVLNRITQRQNRIMEEVSEKINKWMKKQDDDNR